MLIKGIDDMDIKTLKSFMTVAKHQSFSEAARELFNRTSREVTITPAGEQLLKDAAVIWTLAEQAKTQVKRAHDGQVGTLNIAHLSSACLTFMATLVRSYKAQFPHVHVSLFEMTVTEQIEAFNNDRIDIAF